MPSNSLGIPLLSASSLICFAFSTCLLFYGVMNSITMLLFSVLVFLGLLLIWRTNSAPVNRNDDMDLTDLFESEIPESSEHAPPVAKADSKGIPSELLGMSFILVMGFLYCHRRPSSRVNRSNQPGPGNPTADPELIRRMSEGGGITVGGARWILFYIIMGFCIFLGYTFTEIGNLL